MQLLALCFAVGVEMLVVLQVVISELHFGPVDVDHRHRYRHLTLRHRQRCLPNFDPLHCLEDRSVKGGEMWVMMLESEMTVEEKRERFAERTLQVTLRPHRRVR